METFQVVILGCGSALPTHRHNNAALAVNFRNKLFLIDCGEGTQLQMRKCRLSFSRLGHVFISHLHGDHFFGLIGLISTMNLLGRTAQLYVHAPKPIREILLPQLAFFCPDLTYEVILDEIDTTRHALIYEDRSLEVWSLPLDHRMPCCGFLFQEKPLKRHINMNMIKAYDIPYYALNSIKDGQDYTLPDGTTIPNEKLTTPADAHRSFAYCSDTAYKPELTSYLQNVDVLLHEATFGKDKEKMAEITHHSTAAQAAMIARDSHVRQLLLGHYSARYTDENVLLHEAQEIFPDTRLTKETDVIEIQPRH